MKKYRDASKEKIILEACKVGAARELFEETGIDVRNQLDRLEPAAILPPELGDKLSCMLKNKCYFHLEVNDKDFPSAVSKECSICAETCSLVRDARSILIYSLSFVIIAYSVLRFKR